MNKPWIRNTDKEIESFHPVCEEALEKALENLGMTAQYEVQHHRFVGPLEIDFVIANKITNKVLCVVEVKRTIPSVFSTRYQYQAMSYVQSLRDSLKESQYYLLTSLECSALFKYSNDRPNAYEQLLEPGIEILHRFSDLPKEEFLNDLIKQYQSYIEIIKGDTGKYVLSFKKIAEEVKACMWSLQKYRSTLIPLFYEYIRGALKKVSRQELQPIARLAYKYDLICKEGRKVNFKDIFNAECIGDANVVNVEHSLLKEIHRIGDKYIDADAITNVLHSVVSEGHAHDGEVATDIELAIVIMQIIKNIGGELQQNERIMDPAAGSGNLLSAAITVFKDINPNQLVANDVNKLLLQLLSLRLGLKFPTVISKENSPIITSENIAMLPVSCFQNVKYIVMNPPFLAAIGEDCIKRKEVIYKRIEKLAGSVAITKRGQMPLEGPFLELISLLAKKGTIMACILPHTHLTARGDASAAIREMLLETFGLCMVFNYPQTMLFDKVTQNTVIVIGICGIQSDTIKYLYSNDIISEVDASVMDKVMSHHFDKIKMDDLSDNFEGMEVSFESLKNDIHHGWNVFNVSRQQAHAFIMSNITSNSKLKLTSQSEFKDMYRGKIGNSGGSDLLYYTCRENFSNYVESLTGITGSPGLRNADYAHYVVGNGDQKFLDIRGTDEAITEKVIEYYKDNIERAQTKQRRVSKSLYDYKVLLQREAEKIVPAYSILTPRAVRSEARIFILNKDTYVSTNFFVFETRSEKEMKIYSSWMLSVFFQLECEVVAKNNAGLRKMEKAEYNVTHMPNIDELTDMEAAQIVKDIETCPEFIDLRNPKARTVDRIWSKILFGDSAEGKMEEALFLLAVLAANRES